MRPRPVVVPPIGAAPEASARGLPKPPQATFMVKPGKVIAGPPDRSLVIGELEISWYVLEDETWVLGQNGILWTIGRTGRATAAAPARTARILWPPRTSPPLFPRT